MFRPPERSFCCLRYTGPVRLPVRLVIFVLASLLSSPGVFAQSPAVAQIAEGRAQIVDGDTLQIGTRRVHLYGVDAPETDQTCERGGKSWRCGMEATYAMAALLEFHWLVCRQREINTAGDMVGVCRLGGPKGFSVNRKIVRSGWALALRPSGDEYAADEQAARAAKVGLWSGSFVAPWQWRRTHETGKTSN